jgi:hypothetical protein
MAQHFAYDSPVVLFPNEAPCSRGELLRRRSVFEHPLNSIAESITTCYE